MATNPPPMLRQTAAATQSRREKRGERYKLRFRRHRLGDSDVEVSDVTIGTMTFGNQNDADDARAQLDLCFERGVNAVDTAEVRECSLFWFVSTL